MIVWPWSQRSLRILEKVDVRIRTILEAARLAGCPNVTIQHNGGARFLAIQEELVATGVSQTLNSLHRIDEPPNIIVGREKSHAIDLAPWPIDWDDVKRFHVLAGYLLGTADQLGTPLVWGGDWDRDWVYTDQQFHDLGHFQLLDP